MGSVNYYLSEEAPLLGKRVAMKKIILLLLLLSLNPEQIDAYATTLKKKNDKLHREYSRPREEILKKRYVKTVTISLTTKNFAPSNI
jgi:hypothetical protein